MNCITAGVIYSCGPAQLLAPIILPVSLVWATVQKIRAWAAECSSTFRNHHHNPMTNEACIYSSDRHCGNMGNGYKACPHDEVQDLHGSANAAAKIFLESLICLIPIFGGLACGAYEHANAQSYRH